MLSQLLLLKLCLVGG